MMKKIINIILLMAITTFFMIIYLSNVKALTQEETYENINNKKDYVNKVYKNLTPSNNKEYKSLDYVIDAYDINIIVNENNTFDITEIITAYFNDNNKKHCIYKEIPLKNDSKRLDDTTPKHKAQIYNLSVDNKYKTTMSDAYYNIKICDNKEYSKGKQTFTLKYTYNAGKDLIKGYDEFYYDIIGDLDTVVGNITFTIIMPKEFDSRFLRLSSVKYGVIDNEHIKYSVIKNKIVGKYNEILDFNETLTASLKLPNNYFVGAGFNINLSNYTTVNYIIFFLPIVFLLISIIIWYILGRDDKIVETVEFYPPEDLNSLELGFLYKGYADERDVASLLLFLANKGYIKINISDELDKNAKNIAITKLKEYDGNNINELIFLDGLFNKKTQEVNIVNRTDDTVFLEVKHNITSYNEGTLLELCKNFSLTTGKILKKINSKENKNKIFRNTFSWEFKLIILMIILTYLLITIPPILNYGGDITNPHTALICSIIGFTLMFYIMFGKTRVILKNNKANYSRLSTFSFGLMFGGGFGFLSIVGLLPALSQSLIYIIGYIVGLCCVGGMVICLIYMPKRNAYGNEMLGKIKGFKRFLDTVEKDRLEKLIMQDSNYIYNILPYAYVLDVSNDIIILQDLIQFFVK